MKRLLFALCLLPSMVFGAAIDFRNLNTNHFTTNGFRVGLRGVPTNQSTAVFVTNVFNSLVGTDGITAATATNIVSGALTNGNSLFVDQVVGSDTLGRRWNFAWPFRTPGVAVTNASSGDTVFIRAGNYTNWALLKNGVHLQGVGSPTIHWTDSGSGAGYGILDDRGITGGVTSRVDGINFNYSTGIGFFNNDAKGAIVATNALTSLIVNAPSIRGYADFTNAGICALVYIENCRNIELMAQEIRSTSVGLSNCAMGGIYWNNGYTRIHSQVIMTDSATAVWFDEPGAGNITDMHVTAQLIASRGMHALYMSGATSNINFKGWVRANEIINSNQVDNTCITITRGGYLYVEAMKVSGGNPTVSAGGTPGQQELWLVLQKLSPSIRGIGVDDSAAVVHARILDWQDIGRTNLLEMASCSAGVLNLEGGNMKVGSGNGILHIGGTIRAKGMRVHSTNGYPVFVKGDGLILENCSLVSNGATNSIRATNAQTVRIYEAVSASTNRSASVTLTGGGSFFSDGSVQ